MLPWADADLGWNREAWERRASPGSGLEPQSGEDKVAWEKKCLRRRRPGRSKASDDSRTK